MSLQFQIITLFPDMFNAMDYGIVGRAKKNNLMTIATTNPRDFTTDKHQTVDDKPYGGGAGMVMMAEPLLKSIKHCENQAKTTPKRIYLSPQGKPFTHAAAKELSTHESLIFLCGRYEGIDERVIDLAIDEEYSIGDYVLTGGEFPAMVMIDAITRLLPEALGDATSALTDSFAENLLDYPQYTRPPIIEGLAVPDVLQSGNHQEIARWREQQALARTQQRRPDILKPKKSKKN